MTEADQARKFAELKLGEGNVAAATKFARQYLQWRGIAAPVVTVPLLNPHLVTPASGVREIAYHPDAEVAATARLLPGLPQFAHWASPYQPPPLRLLELQHCIAVSPNLLLTASGALLNDNIGYNNAELCNHLPQGFPGIAASAQKMLLAVRHRDTARVNDAAIYLPATHNYAAWFFGSLPRLAAFAAQAELGDLPIVLHGDASAYQLASLAAMGVDDKRVIRHAAQVRLECRQLYYCTTSYLHHAPSVLGLQYVRERMARAPGVSERPETRRLYLARRHAKDRPLLNEAEVIQLFERHGFVAIDPEAHSFEEQVRFAANAEIIAGPYGANLANLIFAHRARKCLILATKQQPEFARLASAFGMAFWHVVADAVKLREGRTLSESYGFTADLKQTEIALKACLADV